MSASPSPTPAGSGLRASSPQMKHELRRFMFSDRERTLAGLILSLSWDEGLPAARIPRHEFFTELTGIPANHVSVVLSDLVLMRVITVTKLENGAVYEINPFSETWQVKPRQSRETILTAMNMFRELNGLARQSEAELNFNFKQVTLFLSKRPTDSGGQTGSGVSRRGTR